MKKRKEFDECIKTNKLLELGISDDAMAGELLALAEHKQRFWNASKHLSIEFPSLFLEGHYEIIKELCTAVLLLDVWKALDHECLLAYVKSKADDLEIDVDYVLEMKDTRNAIDYRGTKISHETWKNNELKITVIINALKHYVTKKLNESIPSVCD